MALNITFLGHSGFVLDTGAAGIAVDPFLTGNPLARHKPEDVRCQHILLTHGHGDHLGDTLEIARRNEATVYAAFEICEFLEQQGLKKLQPGNHGGRILTDFGYVAFTPAIHSSSYEGRYMGEPAGLVFNAGDVTCYHCGDTALFSDMKLIGELYRPDVAMIPVGDRFTMGPELGAKAAELIRPKVAIPIHYATFEGMLVKDISAFQPEGVEVKVLAPGESWRYGA